MSYLTSSTITIDAILTKKGREKLSKGNFKITKFALSDDEIDYSLYNPLHSQGAEYYSAAIENMPLLEPIADESKVMKYKLITLPKGTSQIPLITVGISRITLYAATQNNPGQSFIISPSTINGLNSTSGYTAILNDSRFVSLAVKDPVSSKFSNDLNNIQASRIGRDNNTINATTVVGKSFILTAKMIPTNSTSQEATLTIFGNETGGSIVISITVVNNLSSNTQNEL